MDNTRVIKHKWIQQKARAAGSQEFLGQIMNICQSVSPSVAASVPPVNELVHVRFDVHLL